MVRAGAADGSHGSANEDGRFYLSVGHVGNICGLLDDLSDGFEREIEKHFVDDRARTRHGGANGHAGGSQFADAGVTQAVIAEFFPKSASLAEVSAARTNPLPDINNAVVSAHFFA